MNVQQLASFTILSLNARENQGLGILTLVLFYFFPHHLYIVLAPLPNTVNIWWMNEQMNKIMNCPLCFCEYAMAQIRRKIGSLKKEQAISVPFLPTHLFLCFHPLQHPRRFQAQSKNFLNQSMLWGNKNEAFGLGIFILILAKDKRKVGKQTMEEAAEKIIIVGESRILSDSSD